MASKDFLSSAMAFGLRTIVPVSALLSQTESRAVAKFPIDCPDGRTSRHQITFAHSNIRTRVGTIAPNIGIANQIAQIVNCEVHNQNDKEGFFP